ncbi:hypothetical protein C4D60_Mb01t29740 [Musa balbisiana]|uniref:Uncharacterized protein n=1 Tax=Musa balbisiana TaxID=52838 RepID=A0A4S8JRP9_MUSBA|nr:hypothetical protein C4D60_Mb01t29740 [Musa balbisiana]
MGGDDDSEQVPRGKDEKDFEKRVKECLKLPGGKRMGTGDAPRSDAERRSDGPQIGAGCGSMRSASTAEARTDSSSEGIQSMRRGMTRAIDSLSLIMKCLIARILKNSISSSKLLSIFLLVFSSSSARIE